NHFSRSGPTTRIAAAGPRSSSPTGGSGVADGAAPWLGTYGIRTASQRRGGSGTGRPDASTPACGALSSLLLNVTCGLMLFRLPRVLGGPDGGKGAHRVEPCRQRRRPTP